MSSEIESAYQTNVLYEKEVQDYLSANLHLLGVPTLTLVQCEQPVTFGRDVGRIDILCKDANGVHVVIEVKRGIAGRAAIGQLQSYMGAVSDANPGEQVRGILVAMGIDDAASSALRMTNNIDVFEFQTRFEFSRPTMTRQNAPSTGAIRPNYWEKLGGTILAESMQCPKCSLTTRVVLVGHQKVCGLCGSAK